MGLIDNTIKSAKEAIKFKETIFLKDNSELQDKYDALNKLNEEYPNNEGLLNELSLVKMGLYGEDQISYQLKKAHIGMYVLRDIKLVYEDLKAQIDYIIITPVYIYYVECKNLVGNIIINDKGDFIREITKDGKKIKKGMYSPLRQVEAQREVVRKIWESKNSKLQRLFSSSKFNYYRRVLVVASNKDTIINTSKAPKDIKYKILRADALVRQIEYDINHKSNDDYVESKKGMEQIANAYLELSIKDNIDYYGYYKEKYCSNTKDEDLRKELIEFRKEKSKSMNIPAYYIFNNEELDMLIRLKPKSVDELKNNKVLSRIKIKVHGEQIVNIINK